MTEEINPAGELRIPDADWIVAGTASTAVLTRDGEMDVLDNARLVKRLHSGPPPVVCHLAATARRLGMDPFPAFDALELFAFVRPAAFCVPTPGGLAQACGIPVSGHGEDAPLELMRVVEVLLSELARHRSDPEIRRLAWSMARGGWLWGEFVLYAIGVPADDGGIRAATSGLDAWRKVPEWQEEAPLPPPAAWSVDPVEARARLRQMLGEGAEERPSQSDFASAVSAAFAAPDEEGPHFVMAEAGTGVGKTLGYLAPATLWAEKNEAPVWVSTYTRNLQHQIDDELDRLFPSRGEKNRKVVVRKGRENYLCLLNYEEAVGGLGANAGDAVALGLISRWIGRTRDGDLNGGDFPSWLVDLLGARRTVGLADRRGECIYASCAHYSRCFIEHSVRKARRAEIVVANHALVMIQSARGTLDPQGRVSRFVFDEGHHVFDAADSAFSANLSGLETVELRRWIRGGEGRARGRARGLKSRIEDLVGESASAAEALDHVIHRAAVLPSEGWMRRIAEGNASQACERFLSGARSLVYARGNGRDGPYDIECGTEEIPEAILEDARALKEALGALVQPVKDLRRALLQRLDDEADSLETGIRSRIDQIARSLTYRCVDTLQAWMSMLDALEKGTPEEFVDWFSVTRIDGRDIDVGLNRHWVDPTKPFAEVVAARAQGIVVTSATLTDGSGEGESEWHAAEERTGAIHLAKPAIRARVPSPFNYPEQTRVMVVTDVRKDDLDQVAAAYRELMLASGGGGLGLFTAISRMRAVHGKIAGQLERAGLPLYAQHVDGMSLASLVDVFRAEPHSCLLGTDAVRDGVDVPGEALRLLVFDRVPWPRPTILHKARRQAFGARRFDDAQTRLKLKQAFGRLVRRADDRGVFILLDPMMPSRLAGAFPEGVEVARVGLSEAVAVTKDFFRSPI